VIRSTALWPLTNLTAVAGLLLGCTTSMPDNKEVDSDTLVRSRPEVGIARAGEGTLQVANPKITFKFSRSEAERLLLDSLFVELRDRLGDERIVFGILYRFAPEGTVDRRYLLDVVLHNDPAGRARRGDVRFFVLGDDVSTSGVSSAFEIDVEFGMHGDSFIIMEIADFDSDEFPDVAYCAKRALHVVGYRHGTWYQITDAARPLPVCEF
jgi:hypothetical protein